MPSLTPCPACKSQISHDVDTCPRCGKDDPNNKRAYAGIAIIITMALMGGLMLLAVVFLVTLLPVIAFFGFLYHKRII